MRRNPWSQFDRQFRETQELLELLFGLHDIKPSTSEEKTTSEKPKSEDSEAATSEETAEPENQETEEQDSTKPSEAASKEGEDEEVKSKHASKKESGLECPAGHCCQVKRIHLWEPTLFGGLLGPSVGYHITWTSRPKATAASSA